MSSTQTQSTVKIYRSGQFLTVSPPCVELANLRTIRHTADPGKPREYLEVFKIMREDDDPPKMMFLAGLLPVILRLLRQAGRSVTLEYGVTPRTLPRPDRDRLRRFPVVDESVLQFVRNHERGVIRIDHDCVSAVKLVAQLAHAFPFAQIIVVGVGSEVTKAFLDQLKEFLPGGEVGYTTGGFPPYRRVMVCSYIGLDATRCWQADIVIAIDAIESLGRQPFYWIQFAHRARLFGVLNIGERLTPYDADGIADLFGFAQVVVPRHGCQPRPVVVAMTKINGGRPVGQHGTTTELLRRAIWHHAVRNRRIATLARLLAECKPEAIAARYPDLAGAVKWINPGRPPKVAVLVETVEHALALSRTLPGWRVVTGSEPYLSELPESDCQRLTVPLPLFVPRIVTSAGLTSRSLADMDIVIRAGGGWGALPVDPQDNCVSANTLLVLDCADRHHCELRQASRRRMEQYIVAGWADAAGNEELDPISEYIRRRPRSVQ